MARDVSYWKDAKVPDICVDCSKIFTIDITYFCGPNLHECCRLLEIMVITVPLRLPTIQYYSYVAFTTLHGIRDSSVLYPFLGLVLLVYFEVQIVFRRALHSPVRHDRALGPSLPMWNLQAAALVKTTSISSLESARTRRDIEVILESFL